MVRNKLPLVIISLEFLCKRVLKSLHETIFVFSSCELFHFYYEKKMRKLCWSICERWQNNDTCLSGDRKIIHIWVMTEKWYLYEWWQKNDTCMSADRKIIHVQVMTQTLYMYKWKIIHVWVKNYTCMSDDRKWYLYEWWQISDTYEWWQKNYVCMSDDRKNIHVWVMTEKLYMFEWWQKNYKCMKYVFRVCAECEQGGDHPHGHHWFTLAKVCAAFLHVVFFLFSSLFAPVKKHLYCSLVGQMIFDIPWYIHDQRKD